MAKLSWCTWCALVLLSTLPAFADEAKWTPAGWGGGGFYYSAAFHATADGVIYLGGDVNGMYRSDDNGKTWKIINKNISGYGVFTIAVDPSNPDTVYAATDEGLSKSTDRGENWVTIPESGKKQLRLTGEKNKSVHNLAVDPSNGNTVYMGTPAGKIFKSTDGAQTWTKAWERGAVAEATPSLFTQMGRVNEAIFGGFWMPIKYPETAKDPAGVGFSIKIEGRPARDIFFTLTTSSGTKYRSKNLHDTFTAGDWKDVILKADDFAIDPEFKSKNPDKAAAAPATPDWATVSRFDFAGVAMDREGQVLRFGKLFFVGAGDAKTDAIDFAAAKGVQTYGNFRGGTPANGPVYSVAVSPKQPNTLAAATNDDGVLLSTDAGQTWKTVGPMKKAVTVAFTAADPKVIYAACNAEQMWKTTDAGETWTKISAGMADNVEIKDVVVSPTDANHVFAIGTENWNGKFYVSTDGGATWKLNTQIEPDIIANPTLPDEAGKGKDVTLSNPRNIAINPRNPKQLYIAANWRSVISNDAGASWQESMKGADISCVGDIRFHNGKVYSASMDEGVMVSSDQGANWKQYWPLRHDDNLSGHYWRLDVRDVNGKTRIISASSPWAKKYNQVVTSEDAGKTFKAYRSGLPDYLPTANTMWGRGYARALAVDPKNPDIVYLGIDGDATPGQSGGGLFKSTDGGKTWRQPANQPGSRRMFFGLAIDPTNTQRLYWGGCADKGGLYKSEDGGESWEKVFSQETWIFNTHVTADGMVYALGKTIHRSTDHGKTWKPLTKLPVDGGTVVGFDIHPKDPNTMWAVSNFWGGDAQNGGVFKTTDGGKTWTDITGDLPYRRPLVLRFNAETNELWVANVGIYKLKQ